MAANGKRVQFRQEPQWYIYFFCIKYNVTECYFVYKVKKIKINTIKHHLQNAERLFLDWWTGSQNISKIIHLQSSGHTPRKCMDERNYKSSLAAGKISLNINKYINKYITRDEIKNLLLFMCPKKKKKKEEDWRQTRGCWNINHQNWFGASLKEYSARILSGGWREMRRLVETFASFKTMRIQAAASLSGAESVEFNIFQAGHSTFQNCILKCSPQTKMWGFNGFFLWLDSLQTCPPNYAIILGVEFSQNSARDVTIKILREKGVTKMLPKMGDFVCLFHFRIIVALIMIDVTTKFHVVERN